MSLRTYKTIALLAAAAGTLALAPHAAAQFRYETPDGHQTIGSAQMAQQQSPNEAPNKANSQVVVPNNALGKPGVPSVQSSATGNPPAAGQAPESNATAPGGTLQTHATIFPQGVGPVEHISFAQRALMAAWLILQFLVIAVIAVVLTVNGMRDRAKYQGGHAIREDYHDPLRKGV